MSSDVEHMDEILGVSFGDTIPEQDCVLADIHIRTHATSGGQEGTRGHLLIQTDVLRGLIAGLPGVMEAMRDDGADRDRLPPPARPVPAWNDGPRWNPAGATMYLCTGFGVRDIAPELGAAVMVIQTVGPEVPPGARDSQGQDYLMGWQALTAFQAALPKVLRKLERVRRRR